MSIISEIKDSFKNGSVLTRLIYINVGVFLTFRFIQLFLILAGGDPESIKVALNFFSVPSAPANVITMPWTPFTYMFLHFDFLHLIFNIFYLYWFGKLFLHLVGAHLILRTYILGGLAGALMYLIAFNTIPAFYSAFPSSVLLGASASAMAILFAVASYKPEHTVYLFLFGPVKLKYIALVALLIDLIAIPTLNNTGGHMAHIGGALMGLYLGLRWGKNGIMQVSHQKKQSIFKWPFKKKSNLTVTHKRPLTDLEYNAIKIQRQKEVDRILDKIKSSGYDSLSSGEKKTLFDASKDAN